MDSNSVYQLNTLISQYTATLSNVNNDFYSKTSNIYLDIASNIQPIYSSLQSNSDHLDSMASLYYVRQYYLNNGKLVEADMISSNIGSELQFVNQSRDDICHFMGVDVNTNPFILMGQINDLAKLIPNQLLDPLNNMTNYLNKLHNYQLLMGYSNQ